jgi:asparagine synthase (glutamine-hydrolysing)
VLSSYTLEVGDDPMEADNAGATAAWLGIHNLRQPFRLDDPIGTHQSMLRHLETPKVNALQGMLLAEFTASHVKVALSGLGGDELFYGYNAHRIMWLAQQASTFLPAPVTRGLASLLMPLSGAGVWDERQRALQMLAQLPRMSSAYGILRNVWDAPQHRNLIYGERMLDATLSDSFAWLGEQFPQGEDAPRAMAEFELSNKLVNDLLWNEDRMSMRVGLESRVPLLDWSLVQFFRKHSRRELMPWGRKKLALKSCARQMLPAEFLRRRKSGFQLDIVAAAQQQLRPVFDEYLSPEKTRRYRLFNQNFIDSVKKAEPAGKLRWHYFMLYLMAQTHLWMEQFNVQ